MTVEDVRERDTASAPADEPADETQDETQDQSAAPPGDEESTPPEEEESAAESAEASAEPEDAPQPEEAAPPIEPAEATAEVPVEATSQSEDDQADAEAGVKEALAGEPTPEEARAEEPKPETEEPQPEAPEPEEKVEEPKPESVGAPGPVAASQEGDGSAPEQVAEAPAKEPPAEEAPAAEDPFGGPGDWYVVHTYAGYENKVKTNLESRIKTMQMQDKIFDVVIPMEDVMEIKGGRKQVVQKKVFPGYLLVKMSYDDDSWYVVRNTPGVTGFVSSGTGQKPTPLSRGEVEKILAVKEEEAKKPAFRLDFEEGDVVRIISGPFADFNGTISDINVDQSKVRVMVNIFDRETPVELSFDQVARV